MKPISLFALFILASILMAIAYLQPGQQTTALTSSLLDIDPESIHTVSIGDRDNSITFSLQDGLWQMSTPESTLAIQERVLALIHLGSIPSLASYPLDELDLTKFNLDPPMNQLHLNHHTLSFGGVDPIRGQRYVSDGDKLHLVHAGLTSLLFKPYNYFIEPKKATDR